MIGRAFGFASRRAVMRSAATPNEQCNTDRVLSQIAYLSPFFPCRTLHPESASVTVLCENGREVLSKLPTCLVGSSQSGHRVSLRVIGRAGGCVCACVTQRHGGAAECLSPAAAR